VLIAYRQKVYHAIGCNITTIQLLFCATWCVKYSKQIGNIDM